ncbi:hypothetical protein ES703_55648 [subsurface metagenome]
MNVAGIAGVEPEDFPDTYQKNVYCQIGPQHYTIHKEGETFDFDEFVHHPEEFKSAFFQYASRANVFIACHFWDNRSPIFFTREQMLKPDFNLKLIADISCDINGPIPSTIRASSISSPFYGYDVFNGKETEPFISDQITVMAVDNLPGELPRDSSGNFGEKLAGVVIPELLSGRKSEIINNATILKKGKLTDKFSYMNNYLAGKSDS